MKKEETNLGRKAAELAKNEEKLMQSQELAIDKALEVVNKLQEMGYDALVPADDGGMKAVNLDQQTVMNDIIEVASEPIPVKVKLLPGGRIPHKAHPTDACFDCYANTSLIVTPNAVGIPLGFCMEIPKGYHAEIYPRSSTGLKTFLRMPNSVGIIDSDYRGEVLAIYEAKDGKKVAINKGDRICQMQIVRNTPVVLIECDSLNETGRGDGGFGSTGK